MSKNLNITVMLGGPIGRALEVSLRSGAAVAAAPSVPLGHIVHNLDPQQAGWKLPENTDVVFLALHGSYGEDGTVQKELEKLGVAYTGCGPEASRLALRQKFLRRSAAWHAGVTHRKVPGI